MRSVCPKSGGVKALSQVQSVHIDLMLTSWNLPSRTVSQQATVI